MEQHFLHSSYRERLIEPLFTGELLKHAWLHRGCALEVATPAVDNSGYDLILEERGFVRPIQLKASNIRGGSIWNCELLKHQTSQRS